MALITDIADAVVTELNARQFSLPFMAVRKYLPQEDLTAMDTLHVTVVPSTTRTTLVGRQARERQFILDVAVQQKTDVDDPGKVDPLVTLAEEIETFLLGRRIDAAGVKVWCVAINEKPEGGEGTRAAFYYPHLAELRQFTSVSRFTLKVVT